MLLLKPRKRRPRKSAYLASRLPVFALEENKVILRDGRVAVGFLVEGAPLESWGEGHFQQASEVLTRQLKSLPTGTVVQKTDIYFDKEFRPANQPSAYYEGKLLDHFFARLVLQSESYLFLSFPTKGAARLQSKKRRRINPITSGFSQKGSVVKNPFAQVEKLLREAEALSNEFVQGLFSLKDVSFTRLDEQALNHLLVRFLNLSFADRHPVDSGATLGRPAKGDTTSSRPSGGNPNHPSTKLNREVYNDLSGLVVGEKKANVITMTGQGSEVFSSVKNSEGVTSAYGYSLSQHLQFPHIVTQCLLVEDTEQELKALDFERKLNDSLEWLTTQDHELKAEELDEFTAYVRSTNARLVSLHQSVIVYSSDEVLRQSYVDRTVSAISSLYGAEALIESYDTANMFFASLPGNGFQHYRWLITSGEIASCYLHWMSDVAGDKHGDYLCDRFRNLLQVNLFNTSQANQNCVVIGPSGSGKSYTMGNFIAQRLERGARQIIIDKGGTYRNVLYALNGKDFEQTHFEYSAEKPLSFNPFLLERDSEGHYCLTSEKSNFLIAVLSTIWKGGSGGSDLSPAERAIFKMILPRYYQHLNEQNSTGSSAADTNSTVLGSTVLGQSVLGTTSSSHVKPGATSFYDFLKDYDKRHREDAEYRLETKYFDMEQFLIVLKPFVSGEYQEVLNAQYELDISEHPLVCFDLDKINSDPVLYPVVTLLITELSLDQIRKYPEQIKYLYLDEAWSMLSGKLKEFIEDLFRTIRKNNGSVNIITQGLSEIKKSSVGEAILVNAATKIILWHEDSRLVDELATHLGFTAHEVELIRSIRISEDFRELFIKQGEQARVYVLETSPHLDAVLSSKPSERNYLRKLIQRYHGNLSYAVNQFVESKSTVNSRQSTDDR